MGAGMRTVLKILDFSCRGCRVQDQVANTTVARFPKLRFSASSQVFGYHVFPGIDLMR
jgi:hypothetical protein